MKRLALKFLNLKWVGTLWTMAVLLATSMCVHAQTIATVTTTAASAITPTSATSGGTVVSEGESPVRFRGLCWSVNPNPSIAGDYTSDGEGLGTYVSNLTNLVSNTGYFLRAYAINGVGTAYGNELSFATLPTLTTNVISGITANSAVGGGNVDVGGGAGVIARGVCWDTNPNPTLSDPHSTDGTGTGSFSSNLTGLDENTVYHVRAYATNISGTSYGSEATFITLSQLAAVSTAPVTFITLTTATSGGNVTLSGGSNVTSRGVCWSTSPNPTIAGLHTSNGTGLGAFETNLAGLTPNTLYYVRAYATNSMGTAYGNELFFSTADIPAASTSTCPNSDFSMGTFTNWTGHYGTFNNPSQNTGFVTGPTNTEARHLLIMAPGSVDKYGATGGGSIQLQTVFGDDAFSARLGNDIGGAQAEQLSYDITIGPDHNFFVYRYAVVLNDNGHDPSSQPSLQIKIIDKATGLLYDPVCGYYYAYSQPGLQGWYFSALLGGGPGSQAPVYWRDWTTTGLAFGVSDYGKQLTVEFTTKDCAPSGHFGYAYVSAFCGSLNSWSAGCEGTGVATLEGPPGFTSYLWRGPGPAGPIVGTTQNCAITAAQGAEVGNVFHLTVTSFNGCVVDELTQTIAFTTVTPGFTSANTTCGNPGTFTDITTSNNPSQPIVNRRWRFDAGEEFTPLTANPMITHTYNVAGAHQVTLESFSRDGCVGTSTQTINVDPVAIVILENISVNGGQTQCYGATQTIAVAGNGTSFLVQSDGSSTMIAGANIQYMPVTNVQAGGHLWGYIAPSGPFCQTPSMPSVATSEPEFQKNAENSHFRIYPNPTTGNFTLELLNKTQPQKLTVDIYGQWGEKLSTTTLNDLHTQAFSLSNRPAGVYFIRVVTGQDAETAAIIKR